MRFGKRPALCPEILEQLGYYDDSPELRPAPKPCRKKLSSKRRRIAQEAAQYFVTARPTRDMMMERFDIAYMTVVRLLRDPEFIKSVRSTGYRGPIKLKRKRGSGARAGVERGVIKRHAHIHQEARELYYQLIVAGACHRDIVVTLCCVHKSVKELTMRRWIWKWQVDVNLN